MARRSPPRNRLNDLSNREWLKATKSFWISASGDPQDGELLQQFSEWLRQEKGDQEAERLLGQVLDSFVYSQPPQREPLKAQHPATFPEEDVQRLIEFFTKRGERVLDPFLGSGSTLIACLRCGRQGVGIELSEHWAEVSRQRIAGEGETGSAEVICGDARAAMPQLAAESFDLVVTSPPYWRILRKNGLKSAAERRDKGLPTCYSEDEADLGNVECYEDFLAELDVVWRECARVLRAGRYACVIVCDFRHGPDFYLYHADIARHVEQCGLKLQGVTILAQDNKTLYPYGLGNAFVSNIHHQYILIFRNGRGT